jgi:hypothetical protein
MSQMYVGGCEMFFDGPTARELFRNLTMEMSKLLSYECELKDMYGM